MGVFHQSLANNVSQFERWFLDYEFLGLSYLSLSPDKIDSSVLTYVFIDLNVSSLGDDVMNAHGLTCSNLLETFPKAFNYQCMSSKLLGYHRCHPASL